MILATASTMQGYIVNVKIYNDLVLSTDEWGVVAYMA